MDVNYAIEITVSGESTRFTFNSKESFEEKLNELVSLSCSYCAELVSDLPMEDWNKEDFEDYEESLESQIRLYTIIDGKGSWYDFFKAHEC